MARSAATTRRRDGAIAVVSRCVAALLGNYALTVGIGSLLAAALVHAGMARVEAAALASMLAYLIFLIVLLWAFHETRILRIWTVIGAGAVLTNVLAHWLGSALGAAG